MRATKCYLKRSRYLRKEVYETLGLCFHIFFFLNMMASFSPGKGTTGRKLRLYIYQTMSRWIEAARASDTQCNGQLKANTGPTRTVGRSSLAWVRPRGFKPDGNEQLCLLIDTLHSTLYTLHSAHSAHSTLSLCTLCTAHSTLITLQIFESCWTIKWWQCATTKWPLHSKVVFKK